MAFNRTKFVIPALAVALLGVGTARLFAAVTQSSTDVPKAITDNGNINSTLNFAANGTITDANLTFSITHTWDDDIEIRLTSPSVATQLLLNDCGGSGDNFTNTVIDEDSGNTLNCNQGQGEFAAAPFTGSYVSPGTGTMDAFDGSSSGGVWTLNVTDDSSICTGTLNSWSLTLAGNSPLPVELSKFKIGE